MRWIIESSKLDRNRKAAAEATAAPPVPRPKPRPAGREREEPEPSTPIRVTVTPMVPSPVKPGASPPVAAAQPAAPIEPARALRSASAVVEPVQPVAAKPAVEPDNTPVLVAISQEEPYVWRGMCPDGCERYFYTVAFTVMPNGSVANVRLISSNYPRLKNAVLQAVEKWRYKPISRALDEELTLRLAP